MTARDTTTQPGHTNRLIDATSPYLLQHARNPVDWYPWGPEALEKARREDKPIFLSIGYSACHWCHVMERESFENEEIARVINDHFVPIKVDREERPDLDDIYMNATMVYTGSGGWPMSVFLAPDQRPFFAGTYFPPETRYGHPGFKDVLQTIARLWNEERDKLMTNAEAISDAVRRMSVLEASDSGIPRETVTQVAETLGRHFDRATGGLLSGQTNKFPPSMAMSLMLRVHHQSVLDGSPKRELLELVELTLEHMADGGIYDHLGGGIARYSTDPQWLVPHFEKMLYDQALVSAVYLEAFTYTGKARYADVARDIFMYVLDDLQSPGGGFYSARDADSEGEEGKFYVWTRSEIMDVLGEQTGRLFCGYYDVTESGNWEGRNILNVQRDLETVARLEGIEADEARRLLGEAREKLLAVRAERVPPALDDKVLTSWNGLMIASLARGGRVLEGEKYVKAAGRAAEFVLDGLSRDGRLLRTWREGAAHTSGYLDDYAFFVEGLLELYEATFEPRWLTEAVRLNDDMIEHFSDAAHGGFFFTADDAEELIVRAKDTRDGAIPAGNSVALSNLLRLALLLDRDDLRAKADGTMRAFARRVADQPFGFDRLLAGVDFHHADKREVVIVGPLTDEPTRALIRTLHQVYDPYRVVVGVDPARDADAEWTQRVPLAQGKAPVSGSAAAYVCRNYACRRPVTKPDELRQELTAG